MKGLLILVGGRPMPNMLTVLHEKPDIIVPIISQDRLDELPHLKRSIQELLKDSGHKYTFVEDIGTVNAFNLDDIKQRCREALLAYSVTDWIFNITGATTLMSIGAYEIARAYADKKYIRCWYLDTAHTNVIALIGAGRGKDIFQTTVKEYITACYWSLRDGDNEGYRAKQETEWLSFAQWLGKNPETIGALKGFLRLLGNMQISGMPRPTKDHPTTYTLAELSSKMYDFVCRAKQADILSNWNGNRHLCTFLLSDVQYQFLNGTWLELYTWDEVRKTGKFFSYEWSKKILDPRGRVNQLDVAMTYKAQLFVVECKTGQDAFKAETYQKLESIANALGRNFVTKIVVTSSIPNEDARTRARSSGILIFSKNDLPKLSEELAKQLTDPKRLSELN